MPFQIRPILHPTYKGAWDASYPEEHMLLVTLRLMDTTVLIHALMHQLEELKHNLNNITCVIKRNPVVFCVH